MAHRSPEDGPRLYTDLTWLWPIISPPEDYVEEAEIFAAVIREHSKIPARALLHLGSGGGHVDWRLKREFGITGVDLSPGMVGLARELNPEATYLVDDMRSVRLGRRFDAVFIDDAIVYMVDESDLAAVFRTAFEHLEPGGVMLTYAEAQPATFEQNKTTVSKRGKGDVEVVFIENNYDPDPTDTWFETMLMYLIRRGGGELVVETDLHRCCIYPPATWRKNLEASGFEVSEVRFEHSDFEEGEYHPMFACRRPVGI